MRAPAAVHRAHINAVAAAAAAAAAANGHVTDNSQAFC